MAIDSASKRASCIGIALLFLRTGIVPDGSDVDGDQRLHPLGLYVGIVDAPPTPSVPGTGSDGSCLGFAVESDLATVKSLPSLPPGVRMAMITAEGGAVRWRADGSDPGNDSGHYIAPTQTIRWLGPFSNMKFIRDDAGMTPSITVSYFG